MKLVCVKCRVLMKPIENGVIAQENFDDNKRGYKIWDTDKWGCPNCGYDILTGFGTNPLAEHYMDKFKTLQKHVQLTFV